MLNLLYLAKNLVVQRKIEKHKNRKLKLEQVIENLKVCESEYED